MSNKPTVQAYLHTGTEDAGQRGVSLNHDKFCTNLYMKTEPLILLSDHEAARAADEERIAELERDVEAKLKIMVELSENVEGKGDFIAGLIDALQKISEWPDGGDRYGQDNIIKFAKTALAQQGKGGG